MYYSPQEVKKRVDRIEIVLVRAEIEKAEQKRKVTDQNEKNRIKTITDDEDQKIVTDLMKKIENEESPLPLEIKKIERILLRRAVAGRLKKVMKICR